MAPEPIASTPASYRVVAADRRQSTPPWSVQRDVNTFR
jgi:hypothetical protein